MRLTRCRPRADSHPDRSSLTLRLYGDDNNQTKLPPQTAITDQHLLARRFYEHIRSEGVKAGDEVLLVPAGVWVAEGGPLRPGLDALGAQLRDAGVSVKISKDQCVP